MLITDTNNLVLIHIMGVPKGLTFGCVRIAQEKHGGVLVQVILTGSQKAEPQRGVGGRASRATLHIS